MNWADSSDIFKGHLENFICIHIINYELVMKTFLSSDTLVLPVRNTVGITYHPFHKNEQETLEEQSTGISPPKPSDPRSHKSSIVSWSGHNNH
jgi:hypothetical protein